GSARGPEGGAVEWGKPAGKPLRRLVRPSARLVAGAWSPDGKLLATAFSLPLRPTPEMPTGDRLVLYDAAGGKELRAVVASLESNGTPLGFSPDGRTFACVQAREGVRPRGGACGKAAAKCAFRTPAGAPGR